MHKDDKATVLPSVVFSYWKMHAIVLVKSMNHCDPQHTTPPEFSLELFLFLCHFRFAAASGIRACGLVGRVEQWKEVPCEGIYGIRPLPTKD